jgi:acylphosphatase
MAIQRLAITVRGRVQGVGFRFFTSGCARKNGLAGWVKNCVDGSVAIEVQGEEDRMETFKAAISDGPVLARVNDVQITELPVKADEKKFEVLF